MPKANRIDRETKCAMCGIPRKARRLIKQKNDKYLCTTCNYTWKKRK